MRVGLTNADHASHQSNEGVHQVGEQRVRNVSPKEHQRSDRRPEGGHGGEPARKQKVQHSGKDDPLNQAETAQIDQMVADEQLGNKERQRLREKVEISVGYFSLAHQVSVVAKPALVNRKIPVVD